MTKNRAFASILSITAFSAFTLFVNVSSHAQQSVAPSPESPTVASALLVSPLPDSPGASSSQPDPDATTQQSTPQSTPQTPRKQHEDPQQKRIFGIMPNFRAVTAGTVLPPQTVKDKFVTASEDSFDYSSFVLAALVATEAYAASDTPEFHTGGVAFGRYYWHTLVDQTSENYLVEFIVPSITHEDTRFYALGKGGFGKRLGYAVSRTFVTRSDSGHSVFNAGEVVGAAVSSGVSNFYYPRPERSFGNTIDKYGVNLGIDMASFIVKEFYPDIYHAIFHQRVTPETPATDTPAKP